ncbi:MAG: biotin/lipoate A/B protein ligase family protein, partial [Planctomycetota bacterium]
EFNMGLDEALLLEGGDRPCLRLYSWAPPCLSLGYFQKWQEVPAAVEALAKGRPAVCRRITGGGAIHHENELTFSISLPSRHRLYRGPIAVSYTRIHDVIRAALAQFGVTAEARGEEERIIGSDLLKTGMCFHASTPADLVWKNFDSETWAKGVGSAQRRKKDRILHHGSIKLATTPLEGPIATVGGVSAEATIHSVSEALVQAFSQAFSIEFEADVASAREREGARALGPRYLSDDFVRRR